MVVVGLVPDPGHIGTTTAVTTGFQSLSMKQSADNIKRDMNIKTALQAFETKLTAQMKKDSLDLNNQMKKDALDLKKMNYDISGKEMKQENMEHMDKKKTRWQEWLDEKGKWVKEVAQKIQQFNKFVMMIARFAPIIKVMVAIILITTNLLFYVIMVIAYIGAAILEVVYFIISLPPFIQIIWFVYFLISDGIPFALYTMLFGALLIAISLFCLAAAFIDIITGGQLKNLVLCQNGPAAWYKVPNHHLKNRFDRGMFCSRPCVKGYRPDESGSNCVKIPKESPSFCPQAQIMRFYSKEGGSDSNHVYRDLKTTGNLNYLMKTPPKREDMLLEHYIKKQRFMEDCSLQPKNADNSSNTADMTVYNNLTMNMCANLEAMSSSDILRHDPDVIMKMREVCNQAYCDSRSTYPFCTGLAGRKEGSGADLIRKIIMASIAMICFVITMIVVFSYINQ